MVWPEWSLTKQFTIWCNSPRAQLYVLDIASGRLLLKTVTGTGSLSVLRLDVLSYEGRIEAVEQSSLFVVFSSFQSSISSCLTAQAVQHWDLCSWRFPCCGLLQWNLSVTTTSVKKLLPVFYSVMRFNEDWRCQYTLANNFCLLKLI